LLLSGPLAMVLTAVAVAIVRVVVSGQHSLLRPKGQLLVARNLNASVIFQCNQWGRQPVMSGFKTVAVSRYQTFQQLSSIPQNA
jgi:hypothetical protein